MLLRRAGRLAVVNNFAHLNKVLWCLTCSAVHVKGYGYAFNTCLLYLRVHCMF